MTASGASLLEQVARDGFAMLAGVFTEAETEALSCRLEGALTRAAEATIRTQGGTIYAARNVLSVWPEADQVWRQRPLQAALAAVLGPQLGLVRALFFDKPPAQTWALPWHKDLTVAVRDNRRRSRLFSKPTIKAGVPHVEAPPEVLEGMLSARIHLDEVTEENGPLRVLPGSHHSGKELRLGDIAPQTILARRGDVLLIRPLVAHCSNRSLPASQRHRRVLHLEFAASSSLPDGFAWHHFLAA
jgi:hypothetical protein